MSTEVSAVSQESFEEKQARTRRITAVLAEHYPAATCALVHADPLQLLVATILSAQCTDERVNLVTPDLFRKYRTAADFAAADQEELEQAVHSTGFFRNKAKNIRQACAVLVEQHGGEVPRTMEEMLALPGVARKTANVVLGTAFGLASGVVVDTHVKRIAALLGLTEQKDPNKIERDLMALLPREEWIDFAHRITHHGRRICIARRPRCEICPLAELCPGSLA
jgi:endonuclease III